MSLAPAIHPAIRGVEGKPHEVAKTCAAPGCISLSQQAHHIWARSYLRGQPYEWVLLPSGRIISNRLGLCLRHHQDVTGDVGGHKAMIRLESDETFVWLSADGEEWLHCGLLSPQPFSETPVRITEKRVQRHTHPDLEPGETCHSCGYTRPASRATLPKRKRRSYTVNVPDDSEIGVEVLDEWVEQFAVLLGFGEDAKKSLTRYHVFCVVMAWAMQNRDVFLLDIANANAA